MIGAVVRAVLVVVIATITLVALLQLAPARRPLVLAVYLLVMGAVAVQLLVTWLRLLYPRPPASPFDAALTAGRRAQAAGGAGPAGPAARPVQCQRAACPYPTAVGAASGGRRPAAVVAGRRPGPRPGAARAALGEAGWALLARDQRDLPDREAPGLPRPPWPS